MTITITISNSLTTLVDTFALDMGHHKKESDDSAGRGWGGMRVPSIPSAKPTQCTYNTQWVGSAKKAYSNM